MKWCKIVLCSSAERKKKCLLLIRSEKIVCLIWESKKFDHEEKPKPPPPPIKWSTPKQGTTLEMTDATRFCVPLWAILSICI